jgi:hypothetical protein
MTRLVGLPASRALAAFGRGDFSGAARLLRALPPVAHRIGGSHAQRDCAASHASGLPRPRRYQSGFAPCRVTLSFEN